MKTLLAISLAAAFAAMGGAGAARSGISFQLDPRADAHAPSYMISLDEHGAGRYIEFAPADGPADRPGRPVTVGEATLRTLSNARAAVVPDHCQSHRKNIASVGKMTLSVYDNDAATQCVFQYTEEPALNAAVAAFEAIAETMQSGARLDHLHRYDRLGLDAEIDSLTTEAKDGRAIELQNIAPELQSIFDDERVMERVRRKAGRLLQDAGVPATSAR